MKKVLLFLLIMIIVFALLSCQQDERSNISTNSYEAVSNYESESSSGSSELGNELIDSELESHSEVAVEKWEISDSNFQPFGLDQYGQVPLGVWSMNEDFYFIDNYGGVQIERYNAKGDYIQTAQLPDMGLIIEVRKLGENSVLIAGYICALLLDADLNILKQVDVPERIYCWFDADSGSYGISDDLSTFLYQEYGDRFWTEEQPGYEPGPTLVDSSTGEATMLGYDRSYYGVSIIGNNEKILFQSQNGYVIADGDGQNPRVVDYNGWIYASGLINNRELLVYISQHKDYNHPNYDGNGVFDYSKEIFIPLDFVNAGNGFSPPRECVGINSKNLYYLDNERRIWEINLASQDIRDTGEVLEADFPIEFLHVSEDGKILYKTYDSDIGSQLYCRNINNK